MKIEGRRILVTGGSSGIGLALAPALLAKGGESLSPAGDLMPWGTRSGSIGELRRPSRA